MVMSPRKVEIINKTRQKQIKQWTAKIISINIKKRWKETKNYNLNNIFFNWTKTVKIKKMRWIQSKKNEESIIMNQIWLGISTQQIILQFGFKYIGKKLYVYEVYYYISCIYKLLSWISKQFQLMRDNVSLNHLFTFFSDFHLLRQYFPCYL